MKTLFSTLIRAVNVVINTAFIAILSILMVAEITTIMMETRRRGWVSYEISDNRATYLHN